MSSLIGRALGSPVLTTWSSFGVRALMLPVTLPFLVTRLNAQELETWFLIAAVVSFATVSDLGFGDTFSRLIAFGMGGAKRDALLRIRQSGKVEFRETQSNLETVAAVYSVMVYVYGFLGAIFLVVFAVGGTFATHSAIEGLTDADQVWAVWPVVVLVASAQLFGSVFSVYLVGVNCIAEVRRWDTVIQLISGITLVVLLLADVGLAILLLVQQFWILVAIARNYLLARSVRGGALRGFKIGRFDRALFRAVFAPAWRSGVGVLASLGAAKICLIVYSHTKDAEQAAALFLAFMLLDHIVTFANVPFYVKLPHFSVLQFQGRRDSLITEARRAMFLSHLCFVGLGIAIALAGDPLFRMIGSNAPFIGIAPWSGLLLGYWIWRYGAMHIQLYSTTNHIIWHYANGLSGIALVAIFLATVGTLGIYSLVIAYIISYALIYTPIAVCYSLRHLKIHLVEFERQNLIVAGSLLIFVASVAAIYL